MPSSSSFFLYLVERPHDGQSYVRVLGLDGKKRASRWIRSEYVTGPENFDKVQGCRSRISRSPREVRRATCPDPWRAPARGTTGCGHPDFITIGSFGTKAEAEGCLKYVKSKFARAMLGVLKVTQHNPASTWKYVPAQDFTGASDIDWSRLIPEVDQQLYAKYCLDPEEIAFIEAKVKPME